MNINNNNPTKVFDMKEYLRKKDMPGKKSPILASSISTLINKLNINVIYDTDKFSDDTLLIQFESSEQVFAMLSRLALTDLLKVKYYNHNNKVVDDFFDSLTSK